VLSPRGDFHVHPTATDDVAAIADADVAFLGLKAYSLPGLAPGIGEHLRPGSAVIPAQNGIPWWYFQSHPGPLPGKHLESVDPGGVIASAIPAQSVVRLLVYFSAAIVEPDLIQHGDGTRCPIAEPGGTAT